MKFTEINIHTLSHNASNIMAILTMQEIEEIQVIDKKENATFLKENLNKDNYADYIEDELLNPNEDDDTIIIFYLPEGEEKKVENVKSILTNMNLINNIKEVQVNSEDWENKWKEHYKVMHIGKNVVIVPKWENYTNNNKTIFTIEPGHLFGTGLHQSTRQCIEQLENYANNASVLDIGCGTGILAIISLLLGATEATAVDIDKSATTVVSQNAILNKVSHKINIQIGNILTDDKFANMLNKHYTLITANIVADVIISLLPFIKKVLDGTIIMAGIIMERESDVKSALLLQKFVIINTMYEDNWVCIVAKRYI